MTKAEMESIKILHDGIEKKKQRIMEIKSKAYPGAIRYDFTGSKATVVDPMGEVFAKLDLEERTLLEMVDRKDALIEQLRSETTSLTNLERFIIIARYIDFKDWDQISDEARRISSVSRRSVFYHHSIAVQKIKNHKIL